jgi:hypothetical protein
MASMANLFASLRGDAAEAQLRGAAEEWTDATRSQHP